MPQKCKHEGCCIAASYSTDNEKPKFCKGHALPGMVPVKFKKCKFEGCNTRAMFDFQDGKGTYCHKHALTGMANVFNKSVTCKYENCTKRASFNECGEKPLYCGKHATSSMTNVRHPLCQFDACKKRAIFDIEGQKGAFCATHAGSNMINVASTRCHHEGCTMRPYFNFEGSKSPVRCKKHASQNMVNVTIRKCKLCPTTASTKAYQGYCYRCFIHTYPDNQLVRNHKTKERAVADFIRETFPDYDIRFDTPIPDGCSRRRPDIAIDFGSHNVIIEIDENQHQSYDCSCENKRLMELFQDGGNRPMTMIRFNPDSYSDHTNKSFTSCWGYTADKGLCKIKQTKKKEWQRRLQTLKEHLEYAVSHGGQKEIDVIHLYYDGWSM